MRHVQILFLKLSTRKKMAYSKSKKAVRRVQNYLEQMVKAETNIEFPASEPSKLAYYIRDGIKAARNFPEVIAYARLSSKYIIKSGPGKVICELRDVLELTRNNIRSQVSIPDIVDALGIIGAAITHKADVMIFPDASLDAIPNITPLEKWAEKNDYKLIIGLGHITLEKKDGVDSTQYSTP